jgi:hypothetical protein
MLWALEPWGRLLVVQRGGSGLESFGGVLVGGERERFRS